MTDSVPSTSDSGPDDAREAPRVDVRPALTPAEYDAVTILAAEAMRAARQTMISMGQGPTLYQAACDAEHAAFQRFIDAVGDLTEWPRRP